MESYSLWHSVSFSSRASYFVVTTLRNTKTRQFIWQPSNCLILTSSWSSPYWLAIFPSSTTAEPSVGELRYIARLARSTVPNGPIASDVNGGTAIEGSDVFSVNGQTRSKFYSSRQFIDDAIHSVSGSGISVFMIVPGTGFEGSSGGPFFRDIDNQGGRSD